MMKMSGHKTNFTKTTTTSMMHMMIMPERHHHPIDALFEDVFGGFPTTMMKMNDYYGMPRTMRTRSTHAARRVLRDVKVEETSRGYLVTAYVPGANARDVECSVDVDAKGHAKLRLRVAEEQTELGLPTKYVDVSVAPKASCIDGVLRVAVLKKGDSGARGARRKRSERRGRHGYGGRRRDDFSQRSRFQPSRYLCRFAQTRGQLDHHR